VDIINKGFTEKESEEVYNSLYKLFDGITPLKKDCGKLCGGACCRGDEKTGMLLFPFEKTGLKVYQNGSLRYAVCEGKCDRQKRPLSCRIFPLFPAIDDKGKITVAADTRGYDICPLVRHSSEVLFDRRFIKNVKKAGKILAKNRACKEFLTDITSQIDELDLFMEKIKE